MAKLSGASVDCYAMVFRLWLGILAAGKCNDVLRNDSFMFFYAFFVSLYVISLSITWVLRKSVDVYIYTIGVFPLWFLFDICFACFGYFHMTRGALCWFLVIV